MLVVAGLLLMLISPVFFSLNREHRILHRVDHSALVVACREMMRNRHTYKSFSSMSPEGMSNIDLDDRNVPAIVSGLWPSYVIVADDVMTIEMGGGHGHCGLVAFAQGNDTTNRIPGWGRTNRKLIEGLWYYSD